MSNLNGIQLFESFHKEINAKAFAKMITCLDDDALHETANLDVCQKKFFYSSHFCFNLPWRDSQMKESDVYLFLDGSVLHQETNPHLQARGYRSGADIRISN